MRGRSGFGGRRRRKLDEDRALDPQAARVAAIAQLTRREFCSAELTTKLIDMGYDPAVTQQAVAELVTERFVDDTRYAESYVRNHSQRGHGPRRIKQDMRAAGLDESLIDEALAAGPDWATLARDLRHRKFGAEAPADWAERSRQMRFLLYRGFSNDHIRSALGSSGADEPFDMDP